MLVCTAVQINNCLKSTSAIKVTTVMIYSLPSCQITITDKSMKNALYMYGMPKHASWAETSENMPVALSIDELVCSQLQGNGSP